MSASDVRAKNMCLHQAWHRQLEGEHLTTSISVTLSDFDCQSCDLCVCYSKTYEVLERFDEL